MPRRTTKAIAMTKKQPCFQSATWNPIGFVTPSRMRGGGTGPGGGFTKDQRKPFAYADENVIARDMRRILKRRCKGLVRYRFVAPVLIDVFAVGQIDQEETAWFLSQNSFVSMDGLGTGIGPGESVVLPLVDWDSLRMIKGGSGRKPT